MDVGIVVAIVFGVLFLGALVGLICLAVMWEPPSSDSKDHVSFKEYTAETITFAADASRFFDMLDIGEVHSLGISREYVFGPYKWYVESVNGSDSVVSREFSTKQDSSSTICLYMGSHNNCYVTSGDDKRTFEISHDFQYLGEDDCTWPKVFSALMPKRQLNKCKVYSLSNRLTSIIYYVDSETKYPILTQVTQLEGTGSYVTTQLYRDFKEGKPSDENGLKPFPGVTVYDFRDGKGDSGNGKSNIYVESSSFKSFSRRLTGIKESKSSVTRLFEAMEKNTDENDSFAKYEQSMRQDRAIRDFFHLPLMGALSTKTVSVQSTVSMRDIRDIPASFDAREHWSNCKSVIGTITDQNPCGSCWAMSSSGVLADRRCIADDTNKEQLSPQYMVYCSLNAFGCHGGQTLSTWDYLAETGTVPESCVPFVAHDGVCPTQCKTGENITEGVLIKASKTIVTPWGNSSEERVQAIQTEIMTHGPIQAAFLAFNDFGTFFFETPKGIYHRSESATLRGGHAVRIIGWGTEGGVDYWLIANSYGDKWGDNGVFRMRRGNNECNLEEEVAATVFA